MAAIEDVLAKLKRSSHQILCQGCSNAVARFTADVGHQLNPPASPAALATLRDLLGSGHRELEQLYQLHDGLELFVDKRKSAESDALPYACILTLAPIAEWDSYTRSVREWFEHFDGDDDSTIEQPAWLRDGIAIGRPGHSFDMFMVSPDGNGETYLSNHEGEQDGEPIADSLAELLAWVLEDPVDFNNACGCLTRYSDGQTSEQWIPERLISS